MHFRSDRNIGLRLVRQYELRHQKTISPRGNNVFFLVTLYAVLPQYTKFQRYTILFVVKW